MKPPVGGRLLGAPPVPLGQHHQRRPEDCEAVPEAEPGRPRGHRCPCLGRRRRPARRRPSWLADACRARLVSDRTPWTTRRRWCLVVPVKRLDLAKTRLDGPSDGDRARPGAGLRAGHRGGRPGLPARVRGAGRHRRTRGGGARCRRSVPGHRRRPGRRPEPGARPRRGLVARRHPGTSVGALAADLPALRPAELASLLGRAGRAPAGVRPRRGGRPGRRSAGPDGDRPAARLRSRVGAAAPGAGRGRGGRRRRCRSVRADVDTAGRPRGGARPGRGPGDRGSSLAVRAVG